MTPQNNRKVLVRASYALVPVHLLSLIFFYLNAGRGGIFLPLVLIPPAVMLLLLTWQVSTGERVNLFELIVTGLTAVGQTLVGLTFLILGLVDAGNDWAVIMYGLLGTLVGIALGIYTGVGLRARNRVLRGVTTMKA